MGKDGRFEVAVTFDKRGYVGTHPELQQPVIALSLDRGARLERDRRRLTGRPRPGYRPSA